jgi:hypothetical protein
MEMWGILLGLASRAHRPDASPGKLGNADRCLHRECIVDRAEHSSDLITSPIIIVNVLSADYARSARGGGWLGTARLRPLRCDTILGPRQKAAKNSVRTDSFSTCVAIFPVEDSIADLRRAPP